MSAIIPVGSAPLSVTEARLSSSQPTGESLATSGLRGVDGSLADLGGVADPSALGSFGDFLSGALNQANQLDAAAKQKVDALASGATDDLHGTMISVKEADISMKLVGTVRNKILDAFQELWRTSV